MKHSKTLPIFLLLMAFALSSSACSKGKSPVEPVINDTNDISQDVPVSFGTESGNRNMMAVYDAVIDPDAKTFTVEPANRSADYHFPLTQMFPNVLQITAYGWTPNFWADIKLAHPFPGSGIDGFDPRVIAILPANPGVSMNYPVFNVNANNSVVMEPDGYTKLFDWINPSITGNANPFVAYFKEEANRVWSSSGLTDETQRWQMDISGFGGPLHYLLVVDVSTNYPNPPQPVIDNASEPVQIEVAIGNGLTEDGGSATVTATFLDWQGASGIKCKVEAPDLFNGAVQLYYTWPGPNPDEYIFTGTISNGLGADPGDYRILLASWDMSTENYVFVEGNADVRVHFDPDDITPAWLNFSAYDIFSDGNYTYVTAYNTPSGLHIFDTSDPVNPIWINRVKTTYRAVDVYVSDGYAYVVDDQSGLQIMDIEPAESAHIVNSVVMPVSAYGVYVAGGYAYVADGNSGLQIIDIAPPESAYIVNSVDTPGHAKGIYVSSRYAYVADWESGLQIIDIDTPGSAYIVNSVDTPDWAREVHVSSGYAYVADASGLQIIDINPPESAYIVNSVDTPGEAWDVYVSDGYAYMADYESGLQIIDIDPPESAYISNSVDTPGYAKDVYVSSGYAYVADGFRGLQIIDIDPPESAYIVASIDSLGNVNEVYVSNGYAYIADYSGLQIIAVNPPESAYIVNSIETPGNAYGVFVADGYAYIADESAGLQIIDIEFPESAFIINSVDTPGQAYDVHVSRGYAYVADGSGLQIIDVDPPESAHIANYLNAPGPENTIKVFVSGNYAYIADQLQGLQIIDITDPESAYFTKIFATPDQPYDAQGTGGYAYVADGYSGFLIIDIDPPENAHIVRSFDTTRRTIGVYISSGYAYVADWSGLKIIDITQPESAFLVYSDGELINSGIHVSSGYAYYSHAYQGFRIIDLW